MIKKEKGITLIALIVTIVVLLILAAVSINLVLGDNGIINKSKDARDKYAQAEENDQASMGEASDWINEQVGGNGAGGGEAIGKATVNEKADKNSTINGQEPSANNPIIPEGYIPINTDTTSWGDGTTTPTQNDIDHGLVITDSVDASGNSNGNEWVWIPVPDVSVMCDTTNTTEYTLNGVDEYVNGCGIGSGKDAVKTRLYSKSDIISGQNRTTPGITQSYREPDLIVKSWNNCDENAGNRIDAGFVKIENGSGSGAVALSLHEMAKALVSNYNEMIASIEKYKGFYVGRYELSNAGEKKNQPTLTNTNWYNLYKKCTELKVNDKAKTEMIWGSQWDIVCNWIATKGDQKSITDSSGWGNYINSTGVAAVKEADGATNAYGKKQNTGFSEFWKANNIYDVAGNCNEWTQEAEGDAYRIVRGGTSNSYGGEYGGSGTVSPAIYRYWNFPRDTDPTIRL